MSVSNTIFVPFKYKLEIYVIWLCSGRILYQALVVKYALPLSAVRIAGIVDGSYYIIGLRQKFNTGLIHIMLCLLVRETSWISGDESSSLVEGHSIFCTCHAAIAWIAEEVPHSFVKAKIYEFGIEGPHANRWFPSRLLVKAQ